MKDKKNLPTFRGRFGTRSKRKKSKDKWNKWRYPRGIDILFKRGDNIRPRVGYRTDKAIRDLHPSGKKEIYIRNLSELVKMKSEKNVLFRLAATIGKKKRIEIYEFAKKHNLNIKQKVLSELTKKKTIKEVKEKPKTEEVKKEENKK